MSSEGPQALLGHRRLDVLDTLIKEGAMTCVEMMDWTGSGLATVRTSLAELFKAGLASKEGRPAVYEITEEGRRRYAKEIANGAVPGVSKRDLARMRRAS